TAGHRARAGCVAGAGGEADSGGSAPCGPPVVDPALDVAGPLRRDARDLPGRRPHRRGAARAGGPGGGGARVPGGGRPGRRRPRRLRGPVAAHHGRRRTRARAAGTGDRVHGGARALRRGLGRRRDPGPDRPAGHAGEHPGRHAGRAERGARGPGDQRVPSDGAGAARRDLPAARGPFRGAVVLMMGSRAVMRKGFAPVGPRARLMPVALAVIVGAAVLSANGADAQQPPRRPAPAAQPAGQAPPANAARPAIPRSGQPGWLGIRVDEWVEDPGAGTTILTVLQVEPGSPAARAGMRIGDRVVRINGLDANTQSLRALTRTLRTGDTVRLQIRRGGSERELAIVAAGRPAYVQPVPAAGIQIFKADSVVRVMRVLLDSMAQSIQRAAPPEFRVVRSDSITTIIVRRSARDMTVDTIRFGPGEADWPGPSVWRQIRYAD